MRLFTMIVLWVLLISVSSVGSVEAAPENHRILLENERVRVLDVVVPQKTKEVIHAHCWPSVLYILEEGDYVDYDQETVSFLIPVKPIDQ